MQQTTTHQPTLEDLETEMKRQDDELADALDALASAPSNGVSKDVFDQLEGICGKREAAPSLEVTPLIYGLRA